MAEKIQPYDFAGLTDMGCKRTNNEDNLFHEFAGESDMLILVADGMGGHNCGEVASQVVVDTFRGFSETLAKILQKPEMAADRAKMSGAICSLLDETIQQANDNIIEKAATNDDYHNMGTTATAAYICDGTMYFGHVGDSRAYLVRGGRLRQLTNDHSLVAEQVRIGLIKKEDAEKHPQKNILTRALGINDIVKVDTFREQTKEGDIIILCSDGLTNPVPDNEILYYALSSATSEETCRRLVDRAKENGAPDNVTVLVYRVKEKSLFRKFMGWFRRVTATP